MSKIKIDKKSARWRNKKHLSFNLVILIVVTSLFQISSGYGAENSYGKFLYNDENGDIFLFDSDLYEITNLTKNDVFCQINKVKLRRPDSCLDEFPSNSSPIWSPTESKIYFFSPRDYIRSSPYVNELYKMNYDGTSIERVPSWTVPSQNGDGRKLEFSSVRNIKFSPDGKYLIGPERKTLDTLVRQH